MTNKIKQLCLLFIVIIMLPMSARADAVEIDGIYYIIAEKLNTAEVTSKPGNYSGDIVIPASIDYNGNTYNVTTISDYAFQNCNNLTTVVLPEGMTSIGNFAFKGCSSLTTVNFPSSLIYVGDNSFMNCISLESVTIPDGIVAIGVSSDEGPYFGAGAFVYCSGMKSLTIPESVKVIDSGFQGCSSLTSVNIPNSVTFINKPSFCDCSSLETLTIGSGIEKIKRAFQNCPNLMRVYCYAEQVPETDARAFDGSYIDQATLYVPASSIDNYKEVAPWSGFKEIKSIGSDGTGEIDADPSETVQIDGICYNILYKINTAEVTSKPGNYSGDIVIPASIDYNDNIYNVTTISDYAFQNCNNLTTVVLPEGMTSIGNYAFKDCSSLTTVNLPSSLIYVGDNSFMSCISLESVTIPDGIIAIGVPSNEGPYFGAGAFIFCSGMKSLTIPESVKVIDSGFQGCSSLTSVNIPNSVTFINSPSFCDCSSLETLTIGSGIEKIKRAFKNCPNLTKVYCYAEQVPETDAKAFDGSYIEQATLYVPASSIDSYKEVVPWSGFKEIVSLPGESYTLTYIVDGEVYRIYTIEVGTTIIPEEAPAQVGYTFSGWSDIPETMPAYDVTVTGTFVVNMYNLSYVIDGYTYKEYEIEYGSSITPEPDPTWEGYTFSGWSDIPETMPANDVTVYGTFTVNKYKLIYIVDGQTYKEYEIEYGASITPEPDPTLEGYTFSGWSEIPETMPAHDVEITGSFTQIVKADPNLAINGKGTFIAELGFIVTLGQPNEFPELFNPYGLSPIEWTSSNPNVATVDANGVLTLLSVGETQIIATFAGNNEYEAGMAEYSLVVIDSGYTMDDDGNVTVIGGDQTGDVTIDASITINGHTYQVTSIAAYAFKDNQNITSLTIPAGITTIGDNAFNGCINLIVINIGKDVQSIGNKAFANIGTAAVRTRSDEASFVVNCYAESVPQAAWDTFENSPIETGILYVEDDLKDSYMATSPWNKFGKVLGFNEPAGIKAIMTDSNDAHIYDIQGNRLDNVRRGVNIIRTKEGKTKKVILK